MILAQDLRETLRPQPIGEGTRRLILEKTSHRHCRPFLMDHSRRDDLPPPAMLGSQTPERNRMSQSRIIPVARRPPSRFRPGMNINASAPPFAAFEEESNRPTRECEAKRN
jgi:hypothetical protein